MIFDKANLLSDAQAVTATAATTNYIDLGADRNIGNGEPIELFAMVTTTTTSGGSTTMTFALQTDSDSAFGSAETLLVTGSIAKATLVAGYEFLRVRLPQGVKRYVRGYFTVSTADFTAGNFTVGLLLDRQAQAYYASGLRTSGF